MKNKERFLNKLKDAIFKSSNYDGKIDDFKKQKDETNENIKMLILENKPMFKKRKLSDLFTYKFIHVGYILSILMCLISSVYGANLLDVSTFSEGKEIPSFEPELLCFFDVLSISLIFIFAKLKDDRAKNKKVKFLSKLKCLRNKKKQIMTSMRNIDNEKKNIGKMIENFESNNSNDNKKLTDLPVSVDILKSIHLYFSEGEIEKMMYVKNKSYLSYYDIFNFMNKNEKEIKELSNYIKNTDKVEDVYYSNSTATAIKC